MMKYAKKGQQTLLICHYPSDEAVEEKLIKQPLFEAVEETVREFGRFAADGDDWDAKRLARSVAAELQERIGYCDLNGVKAYYRKGKSVFGTDEVDMTFESPDETFSISAIELPF